MPEIKTLFNSYEIIQDLKSDGVFKWVRANDLSGDRKVIIQYVILDISHEQIDLLFDFFDNFQSVSKQKLYRPESVLGDKDIPVAAVYEDIEFKTLPSNVSDNYEEYLVWWETAIEQLHYAHQRDLIHGYISPDNFVIDKENILLVNYGYAPFLEYGNAEAIKQVGNYCAPEIISEQSITPLSDIFSFAKVIADLLPEFKNTYLYKDATSNNLEDRPRRMRNFLKKLKSDLVYIKTQSDEKKEIEDDKTEKDSGDIRRKYSLIVNINPPEGGTVDGAGNYMEFKEAQVNAKPSEGYIFDHWEGDININEIRTSIKMDGDKNIIALFKKDPSYKPPTEEQEPVLFNLKLEAIPSNAGRVIGKGKYPENHSVEIKAIPSEGYRFDSWTKDLKSTNNPEQIIITSDKLVQAKFSAGKKVKLNISTAPSDVGQVSCKKEYISGEKARLRAISSNHKWSFVRWSGDISGSSNPISIIMDKDKNVVAHFEKNIWAGILLETRGDPPEGGTVKGGNKKYLRDESISLEAKPNKGWKFSEWSGAYEGKNERIRIIINEGITLVAHFKKIEEEKDKPNLPGWLLSEDKLTPKSGKKESQKKPETNESKEIDPSKNNGNDGEINKSPFDMKNEVEKKAKQKTKKGDLDILGPAFRDEIERNKH